MDPRKNPYAPGAGQRPPELAGRNDILERAAVALDRIRAGRAARSIILYGLRGVGKTVLLNKIMLDAESRGVVAISIEAPENRSLPGLLVPKLRAVLLRIDRSAAVKASVKAALRALGSFASALKIKYRDIEISADLEKELGVADSGDLEADLSDLLVKAGVAAHDQGTAIVLAIDELQYVPEEQLGALISALHRVSQRQLPLTMVAAGLPQLLGQMGKAKSYAERLFEFMPVDKLDRQAARSALCKPAEEEQVAYSPAAVEEVFRQTQGYPYFIQEWGKQSWNTAAKSPIAEPDVKLATTIAFDELDAGFFRVRFDRLTPNEKRYMRAMAELGPGPHRSGEIAEKLERSVSAVAPTRAALIAKGMIYSPSHGDTAFTVPLFDGFMKRTMKWRPNANSDNP